jgi:hypothetical protein
MFKVAICGLKDFSLPFKGRVRVGMGWFGKQNLSQIVISYLVADCDHLTLATKK